jgi:hypothetical protein
MLPHPMMALRGARRGFERDDVALFKSSMIEDSPSRRVLTRPSFLAPGLYCREKALS